MVVDAEACETGQLLVLRAQQFEGLTHLQFTQSEGDLVVVLEADAVRNLGIEVVKRLTTHLLKHRLQVFLGMGEIFIIHNSQCIMHNYLAQKAS